LDFHRYVLVSISFSPSFSCTAYVYFPFVLFRDVRCFQSQQLFLLHFIISLCLLYTYATNRHPSGLLLVSRVFRILAPIPPFHLSSYRHFLLDSFLLSLSPSTRLSISLRHLSRNADYLFRIQVALCTRRPEYGYDFSVHNDAQTYLDLRAASSGHHPHLSMSLRPPFLLVFPTHPLPSRRISCRAAHRA
jgi:hypothetical protein